VFTACVVPLSTNLESINVLESFHLGSVLVVPFPSTASVIPYPLNVVGLLVIEVQSVVATAPWIASSKATNASFSPSVEPNVITAKSASHLFTSDVAIASFSCSLLNYPITIFLIYVKLL